MIINKKVERYNLNKASYNSSRFCSGLNKTPIAKQFDDMHSGGHLAFADAIKLLDRVFSGDKSYSEMAKAILDNYNGITNKYSIFATVCSLYYNMQNTAQNDIFKIYRSNSKDNLLSEKNIK